MERGRPIHQLTHTEARQTCLARSGRDERKRRAHTRPELKENEIMVPTAMATPVGLAAVPVNALTRHMPVLAGDAAARPVAQLRPPIRGGLPPHARRRVREFIEAHLTENITIQVLAAIAGLSMFHFARTFKQSEGVTPHEYLVQRRVQRAQDLLTATNLSLAEVALAAGFTDQSHCARWFRQHVGVTPGRYRWALR
jgi:AraC-like DNA-binding protein